MGSEMCIRDSYDGIEASVISDYPYLLKYHEKVANEPRIRAHYNEVADGDIRWTFLPGAFDGGVTLD